MSRYRGPQTRISRRLGVMVFTNGQSKVKAFQKKNYKPGMHGQKHFSKSSEYGTQLKEKQKAKYLYGITEKQCKNTYKKATKSVGNTGLVFMQLLERRLDNVVYRSGLAQTRPQARQMVSHGLIMINGKRAKTPSILVEEGDKFEVVSKKKASKLFEEAKKAKIRSPRWITFDQKNLAGEVKGFPEKGDLEGLVEPQLIVEFYSK
ncbi:MAG: 30S ribosomal protein S4 [Candidatus Gracilibacteria bacterium]|nr:30S ribosomal protein S4 [Candidatus Gracilibacteria bacterium]